VCANESYIFKQCAYIEFITQSQIVWKEQKRAWFLSFLWDPLWSPSELMLLIIALHESGTRQDISWSVTVYTKHLSSQCKLTAQIVQMQNKMSFISVIFIGEWNHG
jgi:hypothetical protein